MTSNPQTNQSAHPILHAADLAAEELQTLRERLSCDTRHSFRTPLTVIDGTARRLARNAATMTPDEIASRVHTIRATVDKMVAIVERSIEMSELASCVKVTNPSPTPLRSVIEKLISEHKQSTPRIGFILSFDNSDDLVTSDQRLLELLLDKLLALGVGFAREQGRIELVTWSDGNNANFSLKAIFDSHSPKDIKELNDCLHETEERLTLLCKGMELKLIRLIVDQHGGDLEIVKEPNLVEFDLQIPITEPSNVSCLICVQASLSYQE